MTTQPRSFDHATQKHVSTISMPLPKFQGSVINKVMSDLCGAWRTQVLLAAEQMDLFSHIARGRTTTSEIAEATAASPRGIRALLDVLVGMGYLSKNEQHYALKSEIGNLLPLLRSPFVGGLREMIQKSWGTWGHLAEAIKTGQPVCEPDQQENAFPRLATALFYGHYAMGRNLARTLISISDSPVKDILDIGAGSGAWSIPFVQAIPEAHITALDLPEVIPVTRRFTNMLGVTPRYSFIGADVTTMDFAQQTYDLIIVGQLLHCIGSRCARDLLKKAFCALRNNGWLVIAESAPTEDVTDIKPILFGLHLLLHSKQGEVFTAPECEDWLKDAGFNNIGTLPGSTSLLMFARK